MKIHDNVLGWMWSKQLQLPDNYQSKTGKIKSLKSWKIMILGMTAEHN